MKSIWHQQFLRLGACALAIGLSLPALAQQQKVLDPTLLMVGTPPPPEYRVTIDNWQEYPQKIWSFQHTSELFPTRLIARAGKVHELPLSMLPRAEIDAIAVNAPGEPAMNWPQMLKDTHTDAIVVLHRGRIVEERYFNGMKASTAHLMFSASKAMTGLMAATLIQEGRLDEKAKVGSLIPELADSAWAGASVRQVLDMTDGVQFTEIYNDPSSDVFRYIGSMGWAPKLRQPGSPEGILAMLPTLKNLQVEPRGTAFRYRSPATDVSGWIAARTAGQSISNWLEQRLWSRLGMEQDARMMLDPMANEVTFAGMIAAPRDLARLGQLLLQRGRWGDAQVLPAALTDELTRGGDTQAFAVGGPKTRSGWSYRSQWWVNPAAPRSFAALGAFGQMLYVFPEAETVVVKLSSHPNPISAVTDRVHQRAFAALINHLQTKPR